jgi:tRNA uridine 5-carboxymethylaminomethyl modification enzyme
MFVYPKHYDVIVVGAGHAGVEAALAAARMGCQTLLLTMNADSIGQMSCNPAIGGLAKGHLAREIDALGGEMGVNTDMTGLQFRMLNTKKGPAVWAPRAQCDKKAYQFRLKHVCEAEPNLDVKQGQSTRLVLKNGAAVGVETSLQVQYMGKAVVITTGTFLRGLMHIGSNQQSGGRAGDVAAMNLSASLKEAGLELGRLKTGTPPRLLRRSIDFSKTELQHGDDPVPYFTFWKDKLFHVEQFDSRTEGSGTAFGQKPEKLFHVEQFGSQAPIGGGFVRPLPGPLPQERENSRQSRCRYPPGSILSRIDGQLPCHITYTTAETARVIRENIHKSPMYSGVIEGVGPRYCPSIEDKIVKFPEKERHQIFLEPEGIETDEFYVNGFSTCLPFEVQVDLVKTIIGCEHAEIMRPAYAVEYDFAFPTQLHPSLETKVCENLFLAGQINGTSGYEEAGAQGLMAGINAARKVQNRPAITLRRDQAYIGVLIDDLITKGTVEPYRMFTSRAEYRLLLRQDNADLRLSDIGHDIGLLPEHHFRQFTAKRQAIEDEINRLYKTFHVSDSLAKILSRPEILYKDLPNRLEHLSEEAIQQIEITIKYAGYIQRQEVEVEKFKVLEEKTIPPGFDFATVPSMKPEARQKLTKIRPATIGQAARISGVTPADISILMIWLKRWGQNTTAADPEPQPGCDVCGPELEEE